MHYGKLGSVLGSWGSHIRLAKKMVDEQVAQGDILACYVIRKQKWVGVLKVLGASDDTRAIWGFDKGHDKYPARLEVEPWLHTTK